MLEKQKGKRPFVSDLFELFPRPKIQSLPTVTATTELQELQTLGTVFGVGSEPIDRMNLEQYNLNKLNFEKKRLIDENKF